MMLQGIQGIVVAAPMVMEDSIALLLAVLSSLLSGQLALLLHDAQHKF